MQGTTADRKNIVKTRLTIGSILLISILGSLLIAYATKWGPWVFSDSTEYIYSARNLLAGHGLGLFGPSGAFHPSVMHPPFYSLLLSFFGKLGADLLITARWLNIVLFGLTILISGFSIYYLTSSSWLSVVCCLLLFSMPALVDVSTGVMSELLFIFTGLASIFAILAYLRNHRLILLFVAGISAGLSMLTRYTGLGFVLTGICIILLFDQGSWKRKLTHFTIYGLLSGLPTIGWLIWVRSQSLDVRSLQASANLREQFGKFRVSLTGLIFSWRPFPSLWPAFTYHLGRSLLLVLAALVLIYLGVTIFKIRKEIQGASDVFSGLILALIFVMLAISSVLVLAFSYLFTYPVPDLIQRTALPLQIAVLLGLFSIFYFSVKVWKLPAWVNIIPVLLSLGWIFTYLPSSLKTVTTLHENGGGYTSKEYHNAQIFSIIEHLPENIKLISNESALVMFYTGRPAYDISELIDKKPVDIDAQYGSDPSDPPQKEFSQNGAALVLFPSINSQLERLYGDQASQRLENLIKGLTLLTKTEGVTIYYYPSVTH